MNINRKLSGSLTIILFFLTLSFLLYFVMTAPINKMRSEKETLIELQFYIDQELITLGQFIHRKFDSITTEYIKIAVETESGFESLSSLEMLINKSNTIKESIELISNIEGLIEIKREALLKSIDTIHNKNFGLTATNSILEISTIIYKYSGDIETNNTFKTDSYKLINNIESMYNALTKSKNIIDEQYTLIDIEILKIKFKSQLISIILGVLMTITGIILSLFVTTRITKGIKHIDINTEHLKNRDLTNRYTINSRDELGRLSNTLNIFLDSLCDSIKEIQTASDDNINVKDKMMNSFHESRLSIDQINTNIGELTNFTDKLNSSVNKSEISISEILTFICRVQTMIEEESSMVEESSAAINQIISTVNSISETVKQNQFTAKKLVTLSEVGENRLNKTSRSIKDIIDSISEIKGMSDLIEDISEKTNLLSMNAAIEAAHAGDAGKGFSVVADEIRKLAEASSKNSKTIAFNIKKVIGNIEKADRSSRETAESFKEIRHDIKNVSANTSEVLNSMNELGNGGVEVQTAMLSLQSLTSELNITSNDMSHSTRSVNESLNKLKMVTDKVHTSNKSISTGMEAIQSLVKNVSIMGIKMNETSVTLDNELNKFKTAKNEKCKKYINIS